MTDTAAWPRITIITPSYQQARFLEATIRSVHDQGYPALEHLVVDGGSTDGSVEIIRRHADRIDWWCSEKDDGQTHAINKGLHRATGDVVGWLNSDDLLLPGSLHRIGRAFADPATRAICGWTVTIDEEGRPLARRVYPQPTLEVLRLRTILPQPAVYWRRDLLESVGYLDESYDMYMDLDYFVRMAQQGVEPRLIPTYLAAFRRHAGQKTQQRVPRRNVEREEIFRRYYGPQTEYHRLKKRVPLGWRIRYSLVKAAARCGIPPYAFRGGTVKPS